MTLKDVAARLERIEARLPKQVETLCPACLDNVYMETPASLGDDLEALRLDIERHLLRTDGL